MTNKEAIFKLVKYRRRLEEDSSIDAEPFDMAIEALKAEKIFHIVTVNPDVNGGTMACSECGCEYLDWHIDKGEFKYCMNCGARMVNE